MSKFFSLRFFLVLLCLLFLSEPVFAAEKEISLEEKIAKMLILGISGTSLTPDNPIIDDIKNKKISGIIIFEKNLDKVQKKQSGKQSLKEFISSIKALSDEKLFIAVDQEGGRVNRLKERYGFKKMLSNKVVANKNSLEFAREHAKLIASEVASVGFNVNFSPAIDLDINKKSPAIGKIERAFSDNEVQVTELAKIYIEEFHKQGLLTSLKHFPGHGSAKDDSHYLFTDISDSWQERELYPYKELINAGLADSVMISHLYNSNIDSEHPATMSEKTIKKLLREEMAFDGVVISDDMQMKGLISKYGVEDSIILGINAGIDLFIYGNNLGEELFTAQRFIDTVMQAIENKEIDEDQIDAAYQRVEKLRSRLNK